MRKPLSCKYKRVDHVLFDGICRILSQHVSSGQLPGDVLSEDVMPPIPRRRKICVF